MYALPASQARGLSLWPFSSPKPSTPSPSPAPETTVAPTPAQDAVVNSSATTAVTSTGSATASSPTDIASSAALDPSSLTSALEGLELETNTVLAPDQLGYLHSLGLDFGWGPSSLVMWTLEHLHVLLGSPPWCLTLAAFAVLMRLAVLRPSLRSAANGERLQELYATPVAKELQLRMKESLARGDRGDALAANAELRQLMRARGLGNPLRGLVVPLLTVPIFFGAFKVLRAMCGIPVPALREGGLAWWTDLTVPDPYFALPIATGAVTVLMISRMVRTMPDQQAGMMKLMMYVIGPLGVWFTISLPAALQWYFLITGLGASAQALMLQSPTWRRRLGLPPRKVPVAAPGLSSPAQGGPASIVESLNPVDRFKEALKQARGNRDEKLRNNQTKESLERARKHEEKRASEDREAYLRRRDEVLRRK